MRLDMAQATISRRTNIILWTAQALLAALFLFAGATKLILPISAMQGKISLPGLFLRCIGAAEVAGAVGLVLPWLLRIRPDLTRYAAVGLVLIMTGATTLTVMSGDIVPALLPFTIGVILTAIAHGRSSSATLTQISRPRRTVDFAAAHS